MTDGCTVFRAALASGSVREKTLASRWAVAVGLQAVDQWSVSERLLELAHQHTVGHLTLEAVRRQVSDYWFQWRTEETTLADKTAVNIVGFLSEKRRPCRLTVTDYLRVHTAVFAGVFPFAGTIRTCNLTKAEPVLAGDTVRYADCREIAAALDYDLSRERRFSYVGLDESETIRHLAANLWQIHAFREGNTRTTFLFLDRYLRGKGRTPDDRVPASHVRFLRDALVKAVYEDRRRGIAADSSDLERFFRAWLLGEALADGHNAVYKDGNKGQME